MRIKTGKQKVTPGDNPSSGALKGGQGQSRLELDPRQEARGRRCSRCKRGLHPPRLAQSREQSGLELTVSMRRASVLQPTPENCILPTGNDFFLSLLFLFLRQDLVVQSRLASNFHSPGWDTGYSELLSRVFRRDGNPLHCDCVWPGQCWNSIRAVRQHPCVPSDRFQYEQQQLKQKTGAGGAVWLSGRHFPAHVRP